MCSEVTEVPPGQCIALSCRLVEASAVDAGGVLTMIWPVRHVSNRRGNPTLTSFSFREGGGPCIHTCRVESMRRWAPLPDVWQQMCAEGSAVCACRTCSGTTLVSPGLCAAAPAPSRRSSSASSP